MIQTDLSNHYPIIPLSVSYLFPKNNEAYIFRIDKTIFDSKSFLEQLERNLQLLNAEMFDATPQNYSIFSNFVNTVERTIEFNAPLKKHSSKQRKIKAKPWLSKE